MKLVREQEKEGVRMVGSERRWLAGLVANRKALAPLIKILRAREVGGREVAREGVGMGAKKQRCR